MSKIDQILSYMNENDNTIEVSDLTKLNIERKFLSIMVSKNMIHRVSRGVYAIKPSLTDYLYFIQSRSKKMIYSHTTALYLNGYTNQLSIPLCATVLQGYNGSLTSEKMLKIKYCSKSNFDVGITTTIHKNKTIKYYNIERTIVDLIKNDFPKPVIKEIIKDYMKHSNCSVKKINDYATDLKVKAKVDSFLWSLLFNGD